MNHHVNAISGRLSLRPPQRESLERLHRVMAIAHPKHGQDMNAAVEVIGNEFPTVTDFERAFPSLCFALATGVVNRLLAAERREEPTEIVIHVNMLKEGWDVTSLYTIVALRAANARILIEQSIGRGLRLPYGKRTGVSAVDRLNIVAHDRFQEIIDEASRADSVIRLQQDAEVLAKKEAAERWCARATAHTATYGGKPWRYALIPHDAIAANMSLTRLTGVA